MVLTKALKPQIKLTTGKIRFIDLFAGVGGFRLAFEKTGMQCVFSSEWDRFARQTYAANFDDSPAGDIRSLETENLPDFDLLCAGFPCQAFSIAGVSKKNALGRAHGFLDKTQGTLFFEVARILRDCNPRAFVLENVKNLLHHDKGRTFSIIEKTLTRELGYHLKYQVINAAQVLPQKRERVFLVGFKSSRDSTAFCFPEYAAPLGRPPRLGDILEKRVPEKYRLSDKLWNYLQAYKEKHRKAGNGFGFGLTGRGEIARTLSARYYKDGSEILIPVRGGNPRRLTPRECARLMGYPDEFIIPVSDTQAYKQFGNSVAVPIVAGIAAAVHQAMQRKGTLRKLQSGSRSVVKHGRQTA